MLGCLSVQENVSPLPLGFGVFYFVLRQDFFHRFGCPGTCFVDQAGLELTEICLPLLGLKVCATIAQQSFVF